MADSFVNDFIEDYYAECDEHLGTVRRVLLTIEENPSVTPSTQSMAELARALHTIKGLSGMVGFADAESAAHLVEEWMRATIKTGRPIPGRSLDGLFEGERLIEACISAHRHGTAAPDAVAFSTRVRAAMPTIAPNMATPSGSISTAISRTETGGPEIRTTSAAPDAGAPPSAQSSALDRAIRDGSIIYEYDFTPTKELAAAGTTVEVIRAALSENGTILQAAPRIADGGGVAFRFVVAVASHDAALPGSPEKGLARQLVASTNAGSETGPTQQETGITVGSSSIVRVELSRLDELMRLVGELVISRGRIEERLNKLDRRNHDVVALSDDASVMERQVRALREAIMHVRMVPIAEAFDRMRYVAREAAREAGCKVRIELAGQDTEVDKYVVERMTEPLLHLVRNAISHGIEAPEVRVASGKDPTGLISLRAWTSGERIMISLRDDGAGIDFNAVQQKALALGTIPDSVEIDETNVLAVISSANFSTRNSADLTSGRGVGMAVVTQRVAELGGDISVTTTPGEGTSFVIRLPLTLMIVDAVMFRMNGNLMAVPQPGLIEVLQVERSQVTEFENNEVVQYRESILPLFHLRRVFGMKASVDERSMHHVLVIGTESEPIGIIVDRIVGQREIVVRTMTDELVTVPGISGATELSDGSVALILDTTQLAERVTTATTKRH